MLESSSVLPQPSTARAPLDCFHLGISKFLESYLSGTPAHFVALAKIDGRAEGHALTEAACTALSDYIFYRFYRVYS